MQDPADDTRIFISWHKLARRPVGAADIKATLTPKPKTAKRQKDEPARNKSRPKPRP
jgi:hypothetical protein